MENDMHVSMFLSLEGIIVILGVILLCGFIYSYSKISELKRKLRAIKRNLTECCEVAEYKLDNKSGKVVLKPKTSTPEEKAKAIDYIIWEFRD